MEKKVEGLFPVTLFKNWFLKLFFYDHWLKFNCDYPISKNEKNDCEKKICNLTKTL